MRPILYASLLSVIMLIAVAFLTKPVETTAPFAMHGVMKNHARYHGDDKEAFTFEVVVNDASHAYGYEETMVTHQIIGDEDEGDNLSLELIGLKRTRLDENRVLLSLEYSIPLKTDRKHFYFNPAYLKILYDEGMTATIPLGTFSYHFNEGADVSAHLDYEKITVLGDSAPSGASASGACITFKPSADESVVIEGIDTGTPALRGNMDHLTFRDEPVTPFTALEDVIGAPFNPRAPSLSPKTASLDADNEASLCVPFMQENTLKSEAFPFMVTYTVGGDRHTLFIDDVRYIRNTGGVPLYSKEEARATLEED